MTRPRFELADVVRRYQRRFEASRPSGLAVSDVRVMRDIVACRTPALGGHLGRCMSCGHEDISYNSCRNRHCPKCQAAAREDWLAAREAELLPVQYFHVVFSLPKEIAAIARQNKRAVYSILFRAAWETLREVAASPKHLGAEIGAIMILHTWGQNLLHHPHVHCVVPGGGLVESGAWKHCRDGFFVPVRVLSRLFRGKFLALLKRAAIRGDLEFYGKLASLSDRAQLKAYLAPLYKREWFVYSKPPFGGPARVLKYLARYTHRTAISNHRLVEIDDDKVAFTWKDYAHGSRRGVMTLSAEEFLRRFLLHVLPCGFVRIRHFGFLANRVRSEKLALCRRLLAVTTQTSPSQPPTHEPVEIERPRPTCSHCGAGHIEFVAQLDPLVVRCRSPSKIA